MSIISKIKNKLNSVVFMWIGFAIGILAVLMMFAPGLKALGSVYSSSDLFWGNKPGLAIGVWPVFVGYMLILIGSLIMAIVAMPFVRINIKCEASLLIISTIILFIGAALVYCLKPLLLSMNDYNYDMWVNYVQYPGPYLAGSFAILSGICSIIALKFDL